MYITNANLNRLIKVTEIDQNEILELATIRHFISDKELKMLSQAYKFFANHDKAILVYLDNIPDPSDTFTRLHEGGRPAYHINKHCPKLTQNYWNLEIPAEIQQRGHDEVMRFRNYLSKFSPVDLESEDAFITIKAEFGFTDSRFTTLSYKNSGVKKFEYENFSAYGIKTMLRETIEILNNFASQSSEHKRVFQLIFRSPNAIRYLTKNHNSQTVEIAQELAELKDKLLFSQTRVFQDEVGFNPEGLEEQLLKSHGFVPCSCTKQIDTTSW